MFKALRTTLIATALVASAGAYASPQGMPASADHADRQIAIDAGTKWVNVNNGDTVAFTANGKTFTWHFDTLHAEEAFDLSKIAPADFKTDMMVTVYVASNPLYRG